VVDGEIPEHVLAGGIPARVLRALPPQTRPRIGSRGSPPGLESPWHARARWFRSFAAGALSGWRLRGVDRLGLGVKVFGAPHVDNLGRITVGDGVRLHAFPVPLHLVAGRGAHIEIGNGVVMGPGSGLTAEAHIRLEDGVELGAGVMVLDTDFHSILDFNVKPLPAPITIGAGARLERHVTVLKGSTIGAGAWIAASSVVSGDIPAGARAAGVPARVLPAAVSPVSPGGHGSAPSA
jgi:acetyltransferase-like isoleucine patch superfamily enzyme